MYLDLTPFQDWLSCRYQYSSARKHIISDLALFLRTVAPTETQTPTASHTPTNTATSTSTPTASYTPMFTPTRTPRPTGSPTVTWTPRPAGTATPSPLPTRTPLVFQTALPGSEETAIYYTYDPLYRLTAADYAAGNSYHYTYDSVGNRLTQENMVNGLSSTVNYTYDIANRLTDVGGVSYTYDANGNLLSDGVNTYAYDSANRLVEVSGQSSVSSYQYNGLGDRLQQTVDGIATDYTLDLNTGLTQVLYDGTNTYTYGLGRIAQTDTTTEYFLSDALGSVRQMTDQARTITFANL